jgi:hypothetical protein
VAITGCINHALVEHEFSTQPMDALHRFIGPPLAVAFAQLTGHPPDSALVAMTSSARMPTRCLPSA